MAESKKEILRDKVVKLAKEFISSEGGISQKDLESLFGYWSNTEIAHTLAGLSIIGFKERGV